MEEDTPHPRVFLKKRLQTIENKRRECAKERKERPKRLQLLEGSRLEEGRSIRRTEERMTAPVHPRRDGKYAQLVEGGGDRGAAWRIRWRGPKEICPPPLPYVFHKC
jgi:hypothetical protein